MLLSADSLNYIIKYFLYSLQKYIHYFCWKYFILSSIIEELKLLRLLWLKAYETTWLSFLIKRQWCVYLIILVNQNITFLKMCMFYQFSASTIPNFHYLMNSLTSKYSWYIYFYLWLLYSIIICSPSVIKNLYMDSYEIKCCILMHLMILTTSSGQWLLLKLVIINVSWALC